MPTISYEDALAILENANPQRAADYRTVTEAVDRLPKYYVNNFAGIEVWSLVRDTYKRGAIQEALEVLSEQHLANIRRQVDSVTVKK